MDDALVVVLFLAVMAYAILGGADFGSGFWDLTAGGAERGARPRALIELAVGPVWETNHTWLIFDLVILWTCFPVAFESIMSTLFIPLMLAALGIVMRGSSFAFRKMSVQLRYRRAFGAFFALSSVITPFFFGVVAATIAVGNVPVGNAAATDRGWWSPTAFSVGFLAIGLCAFTSALLLGRDAERLGATDLVEYFRLRAIGSGVVCGALSVAVLISVLASGSYLADGLEGKALALMVISGLLAIAAIVLVARHKPGTARLFGAGAVAVVLAGWGIAQYPYLLPTSLTIDEGAAPTSTLTAVFVIVVIALAIILPSLGLLFRLDQGSKLEIESLDEVAAANAGHALSSQLQ